MKPALVQIITLNWNRKADTLACLQSLVALTYPRKHILVVDNGSTDGSPAAIAAAFPEVEQIVNPVNLGFAGGFNLGLRWALQGEAPYVFILNNDTSLAPEALDHLVAASVPPDVGVTAPIIYYAGAPDQIWSAGAGRSWLTLDATGNQGRGQTFTSPTERAFISGCGMLIKRVVLQQVGLFDEDFFVYYEDADYSLRVEQAGYRMLVVPQAKMWHKVSQSSQGSDSPGERYWMGRSSVLFFRKHVRGWRWWIVLPWRLGSAIKILFRLLIKGRRAAAQAYLKGLWDGARAARPRQG
ncbi:MAG: glycosyltransferase family 2 protein [Anaerolineales bacterium]|nr:glycosyltransferase family 2 protein [Anaerolineales bacterium]